MKKKEIRTKVINALNLALLEIQLTPTRKIRKSLAGFSQEFASSIKEEMKKQIKNVKKLDKKANKTKKVKVVRAI